MTTKELISLFAMATDLFLLKKLMWFDLLIIQLSWIAEEYGSWVSRFRWNEYHRHVVGTAIALVCGGVAPNIPNNLHRMCTYLGLHTKFLTGSSRPLFSSLHSVLCKIIKGKIVRHRCDMSQTLVWHEFLQNIETREYFVLDTMSPSGPWHFKKSSLPKNSGSLTRGG